VISDTYNWFYGCNVAVSRAAAIEVGGFDEAFNGAWGYQDIEFGYRLFSIGTFLVAEQRALALHQENGGLPAQQRQRDGEINRRKLYGKSPELALYRMALGLP
jgi:GT2 family glycosyltransferase